MAVAREKKIAHCPPRKPSNLDRFHQYDGNVIGGLILGCGMALSGACPGTVLVQIAMGVPSSIPTLGGAVLGGILWSRFGELTKSKALAHSSMPGTTVCSSVEDQFTINQFLKMERTHAVLLYELLCWTTIVSTSYLIPHSSDSPRLDPIVSGLAIGGAQAVTLVLTRSLVGVSTAYENIGECLSQAIGLSLKEKRPYPSMSHIVFILGMLGGSWGLAKVLGLEVLAETVKISWANSFIGGMALIVGARTAGGCTSGHGISGMSTLATSSFITTCAMFTGGIAVSAIF